VFGTLERNTAVKDPKLSLLLFFHGLAREYGWTFKEIEQETGKKLNIPHEELSMMIKGIFAGEARYYRKQSE